MCFIQVLDITIITQMLQGEYFGLQNMSAIIPQPRGNRANQMAYFIITVILMLLWIFRNIMDNVLEVIALHILLLQGAAIMKGICNFAEEVNHVQPRYGGSYWKALEACLNLSKYDVMKIVFAGVLWWHFSSSLFVVWFLHLLVSCLCHLLNNVLGVLPSPVEVSEIYERNRIGVAHGLAWSYYLGYLKLVLPELEDRIKSYNVSHGNLLKHKETWRLHILLPLSCSIFDNLADVDSNIEFLDNLSELQINRAGIKGRSYKHSLYQVLDEDKRPHYCILEYATPLKSLLEMSKEASAEFTKEDRLEQTKLFYRTLKDILDNSQECRGRFRLVIYDDCQDVLDGEDSGKSHFLSKELLRHLNQQQKEEYFMSEQTQPNSSSTSCLSTEPQLMISDTDAPHTLKSGF
nr:PREDICTED: stimulator of interferon genes protein isoform X2 [Latimeria chalumnae]|eukprot:XP_005989370.1 PREDICTED: stimulator of interferon genes protein isoform X2 [Latimeria chalumnae]